jgi:hypothetical protein
VPSAVAVSSRCRGIAIVCVVLTAALAWTGSPARADGGGPLSTDCANFGATLAAANPGDTIILAGLCTDVAAHFTLPATAGLTIEGAATGTNGFDGTGLGATPALTSHTTTPFGTNGITLANLTFENYAHSPAVSISSTGTLTFPFVISDDTFSNDVDPTALAGGLRLNAFGVCSLGSADQVTITGSTFTGDSAEFEGGGAQVAAGCTAAPDARVSITGNVFSHDAINASGSTGQGAGLWLGANVTPVQATQTGNVFDSDSIAGVGGVSAGAGEYTAGVDLTSVGDQFTDDTLAGPTTSGHPNWGAGLATFGGGTCTSEAGAVSVLADAVVAGNSIGAPTGSATGADGVGAGIYAGCGFGTTGYNLTLVNATVSGNTASGTGAVAGIDGQSGDVLSLQNTILDGDTGGAELGGFGPTLAANVTATFSDVCAVGSFTTAFAGAGNICAAPALAAPTTGDVHETSVSPTIDVGANALVPAGVTTDAYGSPRVAAGRTGDSAVVDMGAAEFPAPATPPTPPAPPTPVTTGTPVPRCPSATGRLSGPTLGLISLGATRRDADAAYAGGSDRGRRSEEFFCLDPIGIRIGIASPKLLRGLDAAQRRAVSGRVIWISTANPFYALRGVRPGETLTSARGRLGLGAAFHVGVNDWYIVAGSRSNGVIKARDGIVEEIGIATRSVTLDRGAQRRFLTSFG